MTEFFAAVRKLDLGGDLGGAPRALAARLGYDKGHTDLVLRLVMWVIRGAALAVVATETFAGFRHDVQARPLQIGGFALVCAAACVWMLLELRPEAVRNPELWLTVALGLIAVTAGVISTPAHAGLLIVPTVMAVLSAGSDLSELAGSAVAGLGILGVVVGCTVFDSGPGTMFGYSLAVVGAYMFGRNRHVLRVQAEQAAAMLIQAQQLQVQQRRADVLDERARIAREIHDVLAHSLGGLSIQIQAARAVLTDSQDVDRAIEVLATAQRMASDGLVETRRAVHALRSDTLSLEQELDALAEAHRGRYRAAVTVTAAGEPRDLPPAATVALLRIAQEALINAAKHAPHQRIEVTLDYPADTVRLTVTNTLGKDGADPARPDGPDLKTVGGGYGLPGMRERLLLLGGTLSAGRQGGRWTVLAQAPLFPPAPSAAARDAAAASAAEPERLAP